MIDIITVYHNDTYKEMADNLLASLQKYENPLDYNFYPHSNIEDNKGFAAACNIEAFRPGHDGHIIGFINPDAEITGPFINDVVTQLTDNNKTVIAGCRYDKPQADLDQWCVKKWVCGAAFFVRRDFFRRAGGFDERFVWSFEETDLIRRAEYGRFNIAEMDLPIHHELPSSDSLEDSLYKEKYMNEAALLYRLKWSAL